MSKDEEIEWLKKRVEFYRRDYNTGLLGRHDFEHDIRTKFDDKDFHLAMHDVTGLHTVNRLEGWDGGNALLKQVANDLLMCERPCEVYLIGGDEFMTIYCGGEPEAIGVRNTTSAVLYSGDFEHVRDLIDAVDKVVSEKKKLLARRRTDI